MKGRNLKLLAADISEGYVAVNPILLKPFEADDLKSLYREVMKKQSEIRAEKFPYSDVEAIRLRNRRLQRLHNSTFIIKTYAKGKGLLLI